VTSRFQRSKNESTESFWMMIVARVKRFVEPGHRPDLPRPIEVDDDLLAERVRKPKEMKERVEDLDREMRERGLRPVQNFWRR
jgi:thymidylate kinase